MCVEVFLPLTDELLIRSWDHTDDGVTCTDVTCAAFTIEMTNSMSISKLGFRKRNLEGNSKCRLEFSL